MLGWKERPDDAGNFEKLKDSEYRLYIEDCVKGENTPESLCSYGTFRSFWVEHYPKLNKDLCKPSYSYNTCSMFLGKASNYFVVLRNRK